MRRVLPFIILIFVTLLYTYPFFRSGFFATHDGEWAIIRLAEMQREIKDGQFPPRWSDYLNHGFGYPLFSFTYPFPYYLGTLLKFTGIGLTDAIKILFVLSFVLSAIFMFLLGRELAGEFSGLIASIFYVVAPYRLVDLYVRGSLGECLSFALFPLLFYLSIKYILRPNIFKMALCSVVFAVLILTHNVMAIVIFPVWIGFLYMMTISYFEDTKIYTWRYFLPMILLGLGLSAYFFVPAIFEKKYIILSQTKLANIEENFINFRDYLTSSWSYGIKPTFQLGWAHILTGLIGLIGLFLSAPMHRKKYIPLAIYLFVSIIFLIFLAHPYSSNFWDIPPLSFIDFPWRLMGPLTFLVALLTLFVSIHKYTKIAGGLLVLITLILSFRFAVPSQYIDRQDSYYATNDATTTSMDELLPVWVLEKPKDRYQYKVETEEGRTTIGEVISKSNSISFQVKTDSPALIKVNTIYFPGWNFTANDKWLSLKYDKPDGLIRFEIPSGSFQIKGRFSETPVRYWSDLISLGSSVVVAILFLISFLLKIKKQ